MAVNLLLETLGLYVAQGLFRDGIARSLSFLKPTTTLAVQLMCFRANYSLTYYFES